MTIDPDEQPTRIGGARPTGPGNDRPDDPTVPALDPKKDAKKKVPPPPPRIGPPPASSAPPSPPPRPVSNDPMIGKEIGGCRLENMLGRGAMGAVYKARQVRLDRDVAVKIIRPEMMTDQRMVKRFEVEARVVGKFNSANVVMVHDVGFEQGLHWLVMEFVQGKNLRDHVKLLAGGRLPAGEALPLLRQAIKGLEEAQRLKVVHRDIKPDNLMLTDRGVLKIADFGIAKPLQEDFSMTLTSELVGTPLYMSPEQCQGEAELDFRSDMYSLGATFYYLLTGEPPIRASSVYELIQTKTKLASLCLWKALPGLDENNPLSRVIERMTSLDREDRYGSYEELLNDLVLVEQGQTITVPKRTGGTGIRKRLAAKAGGRRPALIAAAVLLLAVGGGAAWYATRPGTGSVVGGSGTSEAAVNAEKRLQGLRERLAQNGPSDALKKEVAAVEVTAGQVDQRQKLVADVDAGLGIQKRLAAVVPPKRLELPFTDLREHFDAVKTAAPADEKVPVELTEWRLAAIDKARNERELASNGVAVLSSSFTQWNVDLQNAGNDAAKKAALRTRLTGIREARTTLATLVPSAVAQLDAALPQQMLDDALGALERTDDVVVSADISGTLAEIRAEFANVGPIDSLRDRVDNLKTRRPEQVEAREQLLNDIARAGRARDSASQIRAESFPEKPAAPFRDIERYYTALQRALEPVQDKDGKYPAWAEKLRAECRAEERLRGDVLETCRSMFAAWETRQQANAPSAELAKGLADVKAAIAGAVAVFPSLAAELDKAIPKATLDGADKDLALVGAREKWIADAMAWQKRLTAVTGLADWQRDGAVLTADLETLRKAATPFGTDTEILPALKRGEDATKRWGTAAVKVAAASKQFANGELLAAQRSVREGLTGSEGATELQALNDAITACRGAFEAIENKLDVAEAKTLLATAATKIETIATFAPGAADRVASWSSGVARLETAAAGMVAIPAGKAKNGPSLPAFFLAPTECSRAEFGAFLKELRSAAVGNDDTERLAAVARRLDGTGMTAERLRNLLNLEVKDDNLPIDRLSWYSAAACAAWQGRALPTQQDWLLAALGDGGKYTYPFGNEWTNDSKQRNLSDRELAPVDEGALSWRSADGLRIHHLAGNAAEWLAADPAAREAMVAGGRYTDRTSSAKEQAAGKAQSFDKADAQRGFGFRTVLRPRNFRGLDWPN